MLHSKFIRWKNVQKFSQLGKISGENPNYISKCQRQTAIEWMDQNSIGNVESFDWRKWSLANEQQHFKYLQRQPSECHCTCSTGRKHKTKWSKPFEYAEYTANGRVFYLLCQRPTGYNMNERIAKEWGKQTEKSQRGQWLPVRFKWIRSPEQNEQTVQRQTVDEFNLK